MARLKTWLYLARLVIQFLRCVRRANNQEGKIYVEGTLSTVIEDEGAQYRVISPIMVVVTFSGRPEANAVVQLSDILESVYERKLTQ